MSLGGIARRMCAAAVLVAFTPAAPDVADNRENLSAASIVRANISIDNFGQINANYYRGGQPNLLDDGDLAALGVRTVIDLTEGGDRAEAGMVYAAGMKFYRIPMTTHETPSPEKIAEFLRLVNDPVNQPVYVHCQGGRHRTGVMTAVYRMTNDAWTADQAFNEMKRYKFGADFLHPEFKRFVYSYYSQAQRPSATPPVVGTSRTR